MYLNVWQFCACLFADVSHNFRPDADKIHAAQVFPVVLLRVPTSARDHESRGVIFASETEHSIGTCFSATSMVTCPPCPHAELECDKVGSL